MTESDERERRRRAVAEMTGCQALEGYKASPAQQALLERYIEGELEIGDIREQLLRQIAQKTFSGSA
ncbi:hypothetical protein D3C84_1190750 [compost metagenome]|jgi:hypothetical protein